MRSCLVVSRLFHRQCVAATPTHAKIGVYCVCCLRWIAPWAQKQMRNYRARMVKVVLVLPQGRFQRQTVDGIALGGWNLQRLFKMCVCVCLCVCACVFAVWVCTSAVFETGHAAKVLGCVPAQPETPPKTAFTACGCFAGKNRFRYPNVMVIRHVGLRPFCRICCVAGAFQTRLQYSMGNGLVR